MKTCYIYARTATSTQLEEYEGYNRSILHQITECEKYAKENGYTVIETFSDIASGSTIKRKLLQNLLKECNKKSVDAVLIFSLDRLSRNVIDYQKILLYLRKKKIHLISIKDGFLDEGLGMLAGNILASVAQYEQERSKAK